MTDTAGLTALLERVRAASGADREIDGRLWCLITPERRFVALAKSGQTWGDFEPGGFNPKSSVMPGMVFERTDYEGTREDIQRNGGRFQSFSSSPSYTASIDAALALTGRLLPGVEYEITNLYGVAMASLPMNMSSVVDYQTERREDGIVPLAILAALLSALIAQAQP